MTKEALQAVIDQHKCAVDGVPYQFRLEWCAIEKRVDPALARTLLSVECIASVGPAANRVPLNLMVWITKISELPAVLDDALLICPGDAPHVATAAHRPKTVASRGRQGIRLEVLQ